VKARSFDVFVCLKNSIIKREDAEEEEEEEEEGNKNSDDWRQ
jgi:hypothetical protein